MENAINAHNLVNAEIADDMDKATALALVESLATNFGSVAKHYSDVLHNLAIQAIKFGVKFSDPAACNMVFNSIPLAYRKAMRIYLSEFSPFRWAADGKSMIERPVPMKTTKALARLERARLVAPTDFMKAKKESGKDETAKPYNETVSKVKKRLESIIKDGGLNARDIAILEGAIRQLGNNEVKPEPVEPEKPELIKAEDTKALIGKVIRPVKQSRKVKAFSDLKAG